MPAHKQNIVDCFCPAGRPSLYVDWQSLVVRDSLLLAESSTIQFNWVLTTHLIQWLRWVFVTQWGGLISGGATIIGS